MATEIELINQVSQFPDLAEFMEDQQITDLLESIVKIRLNPDIPQSKAVSLIVQLEGYAAQFAMQAAYHAFVNKTQPGKKNVYYSAKEATQRLVDSLKYAAKQGNY